MTFVLDVVVCFTLVFYFSIGGADKCSSDRYMGSFFPKIGSDYSKITWAHGVNSKEHLNKALKDDSMMLEADISLGIVSGISTANEPIMAHPPAVESDITLNDWLEMVIRYRAKGIKLDFKSTDVLEPSFLVIKERYSEMSFPVWINADILPGPVRARAIPVDPQEFLRLCKLYLPLSTISPSWTTFINAFSADEDKKLTWRHVHDMVMVLRDANVTQPVTFPVRAAFIRASMEPLEWLIDAIPNSSLTVWSGVLDDVDVNDLLVLRKTLPFDRVYYDLPKSLNEQFHELKNHLDNVEHDGTPYFQKSLFTIDTENIGSVIVAARTMILFGVCNATLNYPSLNNNPSAEFELFSAVVEFPDEFASSAFDSVDFRFASLNGLGIISISKGREIQYRDDLVTIQIQKFPIEYQIRISILLKPAHGTKVKNPSVLLCLQPILGEYKAEESYTPITCQEIMVARSERADTLFTISSLGPGVKILKDLKWNVFSVASSAGRQKYCFHVMTFVFVAGLLSGLYLCQNYF